MPDEPDDQLEAEAIDEDVVDGGDYPPTRPLGVADALARDTTVPGEEALDDLADRIAREEPDDLAYVEDERELRLGVIEDDTELEGELGEDDDGEIVLSDSAGFGRDDRPAEELALHLEGADPDDETLTEILAENEQRYR